MKRSRAIRDIVLATILLSSAVRAADTEFRGLFVDAFHPGIKSHEEVVQMVSAAKKSNFNAVMVQVRKRGDAYYNSGIEPRASDIPTDYDPLAEVIQHAHDAGLEVHAWLTAYEVMCALPSYAPAATHVFNTHPDWLTLTQDGSTVVAGKRILVDPGVPEAQQHIASVVSDLVGRYQVDGIHLDSVWYPDPKCGYNPTSVELFNREFGRSGAPTVKDEAWCQWRCDQITRLVREVRGAVNSTRPEAKLSASVCSFSPTASRRDFLQDWGTWTKDNLVDFVVPMVYITIDKMAACAVQAVDGAAERQVYIGVGAFRLPAAMACKHIEDARASGARGVVVYSYHYLGPNSGTATCAKFADLADSVFREPASVPAIAGK